MVPVTIIAESPHAPSTPQADAERIPRWRDARDQMIHACALQEHILANAPFLPARITVQERLALAKGYTFSAPEDDLIAMLHPEHSPAEYQSLLGGEFTVMPHPVDPGCAPRVMEVLAGSAFGCTFRIWVLKDAHPAAVAA